MKAERLGLARKSGTYPGGDGPTETLGHHRDSAMAEGKREHPGFCPLCPSVSCQTVLGTTQRQGSGNVSPVVEEEEEGWERIHRGEGPQSPHARSRRRRALGRKKIRG